MSLGTRAVVSRLLGGSAMHTAGMLLLCEQREAGAPPVLLDPVTGGELKPDRPPVFRLSTERAATDGHIVMQEWDLSRASGVGIPVLWAHRSREDILGQWTDLKVLDVGGERVLVGSALMDVGIEEGAQALGQIRRGFIRATSIGWRPGAVTRRGDLPKDDPRYRDPMDDECGQPMEGLVMGSPDDPNRLFEASLVGVPADDGAYVTERVFNAAERAAGSLGRHGDGYDALRARLAADPAARGFLTTLIRRELEGPEGRKLLAAILREEMATLSPATVADPTPDLDW